ncbi:MAG: RNA pyrophosphohydrolase [Roseovarius sp.]|nr:RNA pyrophosphohydrolase [Roseovarius sp.]MCY4291162.1 RNA pyrophosphohydrolase [Roseovarius sp.]MCY4314986.1 RNA pyrophosphohydrolase [Roseovarius sp.]
MTSGNYSTLPYRPCVGIMLLNSEGHVFTGQRLDYQGPAWQMPQGGMEEGEEPHEAALRELQEETGIVPELVEPIGESRFWARYDLPLDLVPRLWGGRYRGQRQKWFLMRFLGSDDDVAIDTETPEFSRWRWLPPAELPAAIVPFKRKVYENLLVEFKDHL